MSSRHVAIGTLENQETRLLKSFLVVSVAAHLIVYGVTYLKFAPMTPSLLEEWNIDTDIVAEYEGKGAPAQSALPRSETNTETAVAPTMLPQLPKQYAIKETAKEEEGLPDPDKALAPVPTKAPEEGENKTKDLSQIKTAEVPKEDVNKIDAKDALMRAALERLRKNAKAETKANQAPEKDELARIADELAQSKNLRRGVKDAGEGLAVKRYERVVYQAVQRHYVLPPTFKQSSPDLSVLVAIVVNARGDLVSATVEESSRDSLFDQLTLTAAKEAGPFEKPPKSLAGVRFYLRFKQ